VDDRVDMTGRHLGKAARAARIVARSPVLSDIRNSVLELNENIIAVVDANSVSGTKVLINPHTHDNDEPYR
jgi:hypothetical protein